MLTAPPIKLIRLEVIEEEIWLSTGTPLINEQVPYRAIEIQVEHNEQKVVSMQAPHFLTGSISGNTRFAGRRTVTTVKR